MRGWVPVVVLLVLGAGVAQAGTVNLSWGPTCWSDPGHTDLAAFSCDTNVGQAIMTMSFALDQDIACFRRLELTLNASTPVTGGPEDMPDWWKLGTGQCRPSALSTSVDFSDAPHVGCADVWAGRLSVAVTGPYVTTPGGAYHDRYDPPTASLAVAAELDPEAGPHLVAGTEYYGVQVRIRYLKTVGAGACSGCSSTNVVWWVGGDLKLYDCDNTYRFVSSATNGNGYLLWDPGLATPAHPASWGTIKSLYR
jgi:hypothetical protein